MLYASKWGRQLGLIADGSLYLQLPWDRSKGSLVSPRLPAIVPVCFSASTPWLQSVWLAVTYCSAAWCNFPALFPLLLFPFHAVTRWLLTTAADKHPSQTPPSTQSVQLIGSWDNFSQSHPMQRDIRRGRDQWRGCYSFRDIVCDDVSVSASATCAGVGAGTSSSSGSGTGTAPSYPNKRHGGLKMGHTYYYYVCCSIPFGICHLIALHCTSPHNKPIPLPCLKLVNPTTYISTRLPNHLNTFNQHRLSHLFQFFIHSFIHYLFII